MNTTSLLQRASAVTFSLLALLPFADARYEKNLPAETYGLIQVANVKTSAASWEKHPLKADLTQGQFEKFFSPMLNQLAEKMKQDEEFWANKGKLEKLFQALDGESTLALVKTVKTEKGHAPFDLVLQADVGLSAEKIAELLKELGFWQEKTLDQEEGTRSLKQVKESFQGVTLHCIEGRTDDEEPVNLGGWALLNEKTFIFATAPNVLRELVDAEQNGRKGNFTEQAIWKREQELIGKADSLLFINASLSFEELRSFVKKEVADMEPNEFGVEPLVAYDSLGLDAFETFWISGVLEKDILRSKSAWSYKEKKGLLTLGTSKTLRSFVPDYIPVEAANFGVIGWDMSQAWRNLEQIVFSVVPAFKFIYDMQLNELKTKEGIDLKGGLLENFGDELVVLSSSEPTSPQGDGLYLFSLKDATKLESLLATILGKDPSIRSFVVERDFMGVKINAVQIPDMSADQNLPPIVPYFAIWNNQLCVGFGADASLLEKVIAEKKDGGHQGKLPPAVTRAIGFAPKDSVAFSYTDVGSQMALVMRQIRIAMDAKDDAKDVDWSKAPTAKDLPWSATSYSKELPNAFYSEYIFFRQSPPEK